MHKLSLLIIAIILLCVTVSMSQRRSEVPATASPDRQWEYGIYQINQSKYMYEWLDNDQHTHAPNRQAFFEKLGIAKAHQNKPEVYSDLTAFSRLYRRSRRAESFRRAGLGTG